MKTPVSVEVLGRSYMLRVEKENAEHTRRVARQVDKRMRAFQRRHPEQAKLTTAIITALALAEDLHQAEAAAEARADALGQDLRTLTETLTGALGAPGEEETPSGKAATPSSKVSSHASPSDDSSPEEERA